MQELTLNSFALAARACAFDTLKVTRSHFEPGDVWVEGHLQNLLDILTIGVSGTHIPFLVRESISILALATADSQDGEEALKEAIRLARKLLAKHDLSEYDVWKSESESE